MKPAPYSDLGEFLADGSFDGCAPGLDTEALAELETLLEAPLPPPLRAFYARCGGVADRARGSVRHRSSLPMLPLDRVGIVDVLEIFAESNPFDPCPDARYLFGDDNSNWAGVFVRGPLAGKWLLLDHDECEWTPRFFDTRSFFAALLGDVSSKPRGSASPAVAWETMRTDYPIAHDADEALVEDAAPLAAQLFLDVRSETELPRVRRALEAAFALLPPGRTELLRDALVAPKSLLSPSLTGSELAIGERISRMAALRVIGHQKEARLAPEITALAQWARENANYTLWSRSMKALLVVDPDARTRERALAPKNWR